MVGEEKSKDNMFEDAVQRLRDIKPGPEYFPDFKLSTTRATAGVWVNSCIKMFGPKCLEPLGPFPDKNGLPGVFEILLATLESELRVFIAQAIHDNAD